LAVLAAQVAASESVPYFILVLIIINSKTIDVLAKRRIVHV
jgi:hypothetical protein